MIEDDDELLDRLRGAAAELDPPPEVVGEAARAAFAVRRLDAELAELMLDSELVEPGVVRAVGGESRLLHFEAAGVSLDLQAEPRREGISLRGFVSGATGEAVVERGSGRRDTVPINEDGWFTTSLPGGPVRVELRAEDGTPVVSSWVLV
jgi:hypothetical protein